MPVEVTIPELGESITEVVLTTWHKSSGDWVEKDEPLFEIESDKITTDVPSPESGVITVSTKDGAELNVGAVVASIDPAAKKPEASPVTASTEVPVQAAPAKAASTPVASPVQSNGNVRATSVAKKVAQDRGIDLSTVQGSGPGGRVTKDDVLKVETKPAPTAPSPTEERSRKGASSSPSAAPRVEKMSKLRQRIAERLVHAKNSTAMLTTFNECDMSAVMALRKQYKESFEKKHGIGLGFMSFFVTACCSALQKFPGVNAYIVDETSVEYHDYVDMSLAVSTEKGLTVPILRGAHTMSFAEIELGIKELALKARDGKLTLEDLTGGTFTITNGGIFGSLNSTPILNPPQSGILGMHAIKNRPVEDPGNPGQIALRPMMNLALSYDHRIVDGKEAVQFLVHVKDCIESPERMLIGV